ncbi:hypothetical protein BGZ63DRAFT_460640 [Mariannaea sp. PMI_226]|nr:hypothetical protein BGZ63DRAFT_460640 [Mariannaea sp. PMI_226]
MQEGMARDVVCAELQQRCTEDIALLACLAEAHAPPKRFPISDQEAGVRPPFYMLSLRDEYHLTGTLAFLSSIRDNPDRITAVCTQESITGITVLVAANATTSSDSTYLNSVKVGFDEIFSILRNASTSKWPATII